MKKVLLAGITALMMSIAALNAQTWQIGSPNAASLTATLTGDTLTINGTGAMQDFTINGFDTNSPWNSVRNNSLATLIINPGVTSIGTYAFYACNGIRSVAFPNTVTSIGAHAFDNCGNLFSMTLSNSLQTIGDYAFFYAPLRTVTIPKTVISIASTAFTYCYVLSSIDVDNANPSYSSEDGVLFNKEKTTLIYFPEGDSIYASSRSYTIPSSVTTIGNYAFYHCGLIYTLTSITIPNSVTSIGDYAFYGLGLTQILLPDNLTKIGNWAFQYCNFDYIKFPKSLTNLGGNIFRSNLKYVEVEWDTPLAITSDVFSGVTLSSCNLIVPTGTLAQYKAATVWKSFGSIKEQAPVTGITMNQTTATMTTVGATLQLTATITPSNATYPGIVWKSSNTYIAAVSNSGLVTSKSDGTVVITATTQDGGFSTNCTVKVQYGDGTISNLSVGIFTDYSYKTISGFNDSISCPDFTKGPFELEVGFQSKTDNNSIKVYLCIPKKSFSESFPSNSNYQYYNPTLDDVDKIKDFTVKPTMNYVTWWDQNTNTQVNGYYGSISIPWDGMSDPAFTNGKSYPIQDNVSYLVTDMQDNVLQFIPTYNRLTRYSGKYAFTYTPQEHSVVCDLYFTSQLPVKEAIPFFGYDCILGWANPLSSKKGGIEKTVKSLLQIYGPSISAYQVFDNLSPDKNGIYHLSWEIKDLQGNFLDVGKIFSRTLGLYGDFSEIGLYVEGEGQETLNLGTPEYGGQGHGSGDYSPISDGSGIDNRIPPRPLNPGATVTYPEFEIENGALMHYHGNGGNVVIPASVTKINDFAFIWCTNLKQVTIPVGVTSIGDYAFYECSNLTSVTIPNTVTSIGDGAFLGCGLTAITIPNTVTSIGTGTFAYCGGLTSLTIPNSVTSIGDGAFANWWSNGSRNIYANWATPLTVPSFITDAMAPTPYIFYSDYIDTQATLHVPAGTKALYQAADVWKDFQTIKEEGVAVTGITLNQAVAKLVAGGTLQLTATISPTNATNKDVGWSSSNTNVAPVSADGKVSAMAPGTATITATALYGNLTATCVITVIDLNFTGFALSNGDRVALFTTVNLNFSFEGGSPTHFIAGENSSFNDALWQVYDSTALKYSFASSDPGMKTIYAKLKNDTGETDAKSCTIFYKPAHPIAQANIYPSPAETQLNIELPTDLTSGKVEVYSSIGRLLLSQDFNKPVFTLDVSSCPSGILIVRVSDNQSKTSVERTVIKH